MFQHLSEFRIGSMRITHAQTNSGGQGEIQFSCSNFRIDQHISMFQHLSEFRIGSMRRTHVQNNSRGTGEIKFSFSNFQIDQLKQKKCIFFNGNFKGHI